MNDLKERLKEFLRIKNYSLHTISNYERDINRFFAFLEQMKVEPDDLMPSTLTQWIIFLRKRGLGNRSIQRNISSLRNFYRYMYKNEEIESNPFDGIQSPKVEEKLPKALTPEDVEKLLSFVPKTPSDYRDKAFLDFQEITETSQQSSRADLISQQQASSLGRTVLAWANTPMQYMRIQEKAARDIANGRGDFKSNVSKIAYYGAIQSIIFASLQNALFSFGLDEEENLDDADFAKRVDRITQTVIDGQLRGMGVGGAAMSAIKNTILEFQKQELKAEDDNWFSKPDHTKTILQLTSYSPVIGSKLRKLYSASQTWNYNRDAVAEMGLDISNPGLEASANVIEATTNVPIARIVRKINNLKEVADSENQNWQRVASLMGYSAWDLGIENTEVKDAKDRGRQKKKDAESKALEDQFKKDQQEERDQGKETTCAGATRSGGRCSNKPIGNTAYCTVHQKVDQRADGKKTQCTHVKKDGKRCKMKTTNKSGKCYYHD